MCSIVLAAILTALVVLILVCVICFGGFVTSAIFSDLFVGAAAIAGALYLIKKYGKKR